MTGGYRYLPALRPLVYAAPQGDCPYRPLRQEAEEELYLRPPGESRIAGDGGPAGFLTLPFLWLPAFGGAGSLSSAPGESFSGRGEEAEAGSGRTETGDAFSGRIDDEGTFPVRKDVCK